MSKDEYDESGWTTTKRWAKCSGTLDEAYLAAESGSYLCQEYTGEYMERTIEATTYRDPPEIDWSRYKLTDENIPSSIRPREKVLHSKVQKKFHGHGTHKVWKVGDKKSMQIFTGEWSYGSKVRGKITTSERGSYDGEWANGYPHGRGVWVYPQDFFFSRHCQFYFCGKEGIPAFKLSKDHFKGCRYEGRIEGLTWGRESEPVDPPRDLLDIGHPRRKGRGKIICAQGDILEGQWEDDRLTIGSITFRGSNGDKFDGQFDAQKIVGKMVWSNGDSYEGSWAGYPEYFEISGHGVFSQAADGTPFGSKHPGHKGEVYDGEWKNNMRWGSCVYTFFNGEKVNCVWEQGRSPKFVDCKRALVASQMQAIVPTMVTNIQSMPFSHASIKFSPALAIYRCLLFSPL